MTEKLAILEPPRPAIEQGSAKARPEALAALVERAVETINHLTGADFYRKEGYATVSEEDGGRRLRRDIDVLGDEWASYTIYSVKETPTDLTDPNIKGRNLDQVLKKARVAVGYQTTEKKLDASFGGIPAGEYAVTDYFYIDRETNKAIWQMVIHRENELDPMGKQPPLKVVEKEATAGEVNEVLEKLIAADQSEKEKYHGELEASEYDTEDYYT